MTWHWYVARETEIFLDHDSDRAVSFAHHKLELNLGRLPVEAAYHYRSGTPGHYHMIVVLKRPMFWVERMAWSLHLRSDIRRAQIVMMRYARLGCKSRIVEPDFLITPKPYDFRAPDRKCRCNGKHKEPEITEYCPVLRDLLGEQRSAEYFALEPNRRTLRLPVGRLTLQSFQSTRNGANNKQLKTRIAK